METAKRQLVEYFKKNLSKGYSSETLRWALIKQGYSRVEIERANSQAHKELSESAPKLIEKPKIRYEILDESDNPIEIKKPWWRKIFGL